MTHRFHKTSFANARLMAVQVAYAHALSAEPWDKIVSAFLTGQAGGKALLELPGGREEFVALAPADAALLTRIVAALKEQEADIDARIRACLSETVSFDQLDLTLKCILRAGIAEFYANPELDAPVIITEYVGIARSFYDRMEVALVNAVLDKFGKVVRGG